MACECEITHRCAEAHACARDIDRARRQACMGHRGIVSKRFNIIFIMRLIAEAVRRRSGHVFPLSPALLATEIRFLTPPSQIFCRCKS